MSRVPWFPPGSPYGPAQSCRIWKVPRFTAYSGSELMQKGPETQSKDRGPGRACPDELLEKFRQFLKECPFNGDGCLKVCPRLRNKGIRVSPKMPLWLIKENVLLVKNGLIPSDRFTVRDLGPRKGDGGSIFMGLCARDLITDKTLHGTGRKTELQ